MNPFAVADELVSAAASSDEPTPARRMGLEEPSLPGLDEVWPWLWQARRAILALTLALAAHALVLLLGYKTMLNRVRPPLPPAGLSVHLEQRQAPRASTGRHVLLGDALLDMAKPDLAPEKAKRDARIPGPRVSEPETTITVQSPSPPALLDWWQYASASLGYFSAKDVDVRSEAVESERFLQNLSEVAPLGVGQVIVRIYVNESGLVDRVEIQEAYPPGVFEAVTLRQLYQLRFNPAQRDGLFVKSFKDVVLTFDSERGRSDGREAPPAVVPPFVLPANR